MIELTQMKQKLHQVKEVNKFIFLLIFTLFVNLFFFRQFGLTALALLILALWFLLGKIFATNSTEAKKTKAISWFGTINILVIAILLILFSSPEKILLLLILTAVVMAVAIYLFNKQGTISGLLELILSSLISTKAYLFATWQMLRGTWIKDFKITLNAKSKLQKEKSTWLKSIAIGFLFGLPLVTWLVSILSKADPIFAKFIREIFSEELLTQLPQRLIFSLILLGLLLPLLLMKFQKYTSPINWLNRVKWDREVAVVTIMICLVLGTFLIVQWPYVFAKVALETDLSRFGVATYSEYVQKGFVDLLKVVMIVFATAWFGTLIHQSQKSTEQKILSIAQAILGIEFIVFITSIFRRVWLYQNSHGLSLARLYGLAVLILISGLAVTLALRYFYRHIKWVRVEALWIILLTLAVIISNMEGLIVKNPPTVNGRIDYVYLARLPADGSQGWLKAYQWANDLLRQKSAETGLIDKESRRDLYYAQLIIEELSSNFDELIRDYGSNEEIRTYNESRQIYLTPEDSVKNYFGAKTKLDRILIWNYARYHAYQQLRTEIGFADIARLQDQSLSLDQRISTQPNNEQGYDVDISLQSPFLQ